jgi:cytochrome c-type biogenesis protein
MDFANLTIPLAFAAGFLSFISPCVLPLVPVYLGYLTGSTIGGDETPQRSTVMSHALLFILGFTLIFVVVFGAPFGALGNFLKGEFSEKLVLVGGAFLIIFGLHMGGAIRFLAEKVKDVPTIGPIIHNLNYRLDMLIMPERRMRVGQNQAPSYTRSFFIGMTFAAGWTPCIGPLLGAILTLAASGQNFWFAIAMLFVYSLGLAIPFLLSAFLLTNATGVLKKINKHSHTIEVVSAVFLVTIGILLVTNQFEAIFNSTFSQLAPAWLLERL